MADEIQVDLDFDEIFQDANLTAEIDAGLRQRAQEVTNKARQLDNRENGGKSNFQLESGQFLPNGRRYYAVGGDDTGQEYGGQQRKRLSILRRASGGGTRG